jgi:hypothetical protein
MLPWKKGANFVASAIQNLRFLGWAIFGKFFQLIKDQYQATCHVLKIGICSEIMAI